MDAAIVVTYRCDSRCRMCHTWKFPTRREEEFEPALLERLPRLSFCNVTGGEPFLRDDLEEIVSILGRKARRVVVSTNGYATDRIVALARKNRGIGVRVSLEGLPAANDDLRGIEGGFDRGLRTLLRLQGLGVKDLGFGITVSGRNADDLPDLYHLALRLNMEFATAVVHNSAYFHKTDNRLEKPEAVARAFEDLAREMLRTGRLKNWYRAYFNRALADHVRGKPRPLPCGAGTDLFFLDPWGEVRPCNGAEADGPLGSLGNLRETAFKDLWRSEAARRIRDSVRACSRNCWMIGTAAPAMRKQLGPMTAWVIKNKLRSMLRPRS